MAQLIAAMLFFAVYGVFFSLFYARQQCSQYAAAESQRTHTHTQRNVREACDIIKVKTSAGLVYWIFLLCVYIRHASFSFCEYLKSFFLYG